LEFGGAKGVAGVFGILASGVFVSKAVNGAGADGLLYGNAAQLGIQAVMVVAVATFSVVGTWLILKVVDASVGLRVSPEDESTGLDLSQHNERAYS